jgi:hypothetical protein
MKDALLQDIVIGQLYGYSAPAGSWITVATGEAVKETPGGKCTLKIRGRRDYLYGELADRTWAGKAPVVHIHPCHLFPVTLP